MTEANWQGALKKEALARRDFQWAVDAKQDAGEACRAWWCAARDVLLLYERAVYGFEELTPPPKELISVLKDMAGFLAVGEIPMPIEAARKEGRRKSGPLEKFDISIAVLYVGAVKGDVTYDGRPITIEDRHPIKTVSEAYGVSRRAVQDWVRRYNVEHFAPDGFDATTLKQLLSISGRRYMKAGRSNLALSHRNAKRSERN